MTTLSATERELLNKLQSTAKANRAPDARMHLTYTRLESNAEVVDGLQARGLVGVEDESLAWGHRTIWITPAGITALVEAEVSDQFAEIDGMAGWHSNPVLEELARIVRDQARRIAELEARS